MAKEPCMCGDPYCPFCGPYYGNSKCPACGNFSMDGGCEDPAKCEKICKESYEKMAADYEAEKKLALEWADEDVPDFTAEELAEADAAYESAPEIPITQAEIDRIVKEVSRRMRRKEQDDGRCYKHRTL